MYAIHIFILVLLVYSSSSSTIAENLQKLILQHLTNATANSTINVHDDFGLDINHFLKKYEYPLETHWVTTEDGYILRLHRIPHGRKNMTSNGKVKPPVLLMHGMSSCSMDWVNTGPNKSLGLRLADAGYDVWLGNNRGNTWSRYHQTLDADEDLAKFWDFSFEECGMYDLPAKIDYILEKTGNEQILYVGHSQGTSQFFAMAALRPEYNEKIALMTALAPVVYMEHLSSPLAKIAAKYLIILRLIIEDFLKMHELLPHTWYMKEIAKLMCSDGSPFQELCASFVFICVGFDSPQWDGNFFPVVLSNTPAGFSVKMLVHYAQLINSGQYNRFDYGGIQNMIRYGTLSPPAFNVSAITAPIVLYYAQNDLLSAVSDVERLATELPNVVKKEVNYTLFNHLDYLFAKDVNAMLNDDLLEYFDTFIDTTTTTAATSTESHTTITAATSTEPDTNNGNFLSFSLFLLVVTIIARFVIE